MDMACSAKYGRALEWIRRLAATIRVPVLITGLAMPLAGCNKEKAEQAQAPAPPTVIVAKSEQRDVVPYEIRTGSLSANQYVKILPRVSGFIETINFSPGAFVDAGTVLFTLDSKPFKAKLLQEEANQKMREANLRHAQDELERQEQMFKEGVSSTKELADARNAQASAAAAVEAAKAAVLTAQINLDYCTITSPIKGKVDTKAVDVGDLVGPPSQKPLTTVAELSPIIVNFTLSESLIVQKLKEQPVNPSRKTSIPVKLSIGTENGFRYDATLDFVSNTLDQATGTVAVQATAKNEDFKLYPGLFVRVKVDMAPFKNAILVREDAVGRDIGGDFIWIVKPDNTAEKRYVKLGTLVGNVRVVQSGLAANETYVAQGMQRVRDRAKLAPKAAEQEVASTQPAR
jgi:RND family efflux transporter MFP subunit